MIKIHGSGVFFATCCTWSCYAHWNGDHLSGKPELRNVELFYIL